MSFEDYYAAHSKHADFRFEEVIALRNEWVLKYRPEWWLLAGRIRQANAEELRLSRRPIARLKRLARPLCQQIDRLTLPVRATLGYD